MWLYIVGGIILFFIIAPILIVVPLSLSSANYIIFPPPGFSLKWYEKIFEDSVWVEAAIRSFQVGILTTALSVVLGTMAALAVTKLEFKGKKLVSALMILPMIVPAVVVGIALYRVFSTTHIIGSVFGLVLAHTLLALPIVFVTVSSSLKGVDKNYELAAMGLGSTPIGVFFKVILPIIKPGMLSGALFAFITSLDEVIVTIFVGGISNVTLPKAMWDGIRSETNPTISAVSTLLILGTCLLFILQGWLSTRKNTVNHDS
ncbi:ABC transporter permease [Brevibacillus sp. NRS-1366]|uniref:ABC transporter permease n=1 Tax=Brevibacillus sp. NRS-1366 TaxID=3233899 RepID=UPI003D1E9255